MKKRKKSLTNGQKFPEAQPKMKTGPEKRVNCQLENKNKCIQWNLVMTISLVAGKVINILSIIDILLATQKVGCPELLY